MWVKSQYGGSELRVKGKRGMVSQVKDGWRVTVVSKGNVLLDVSGLSEELAREQAEKVLFPEGG